MIGPYVLSIGGIIYIYIYLNVYLLSLLQNNVKAPIMRVFFSVPHRRYIEIHIFRELQTKYKSVS
jgi:hypothetical protein